MGLDFPFDMLGLISGLISNDFWFDFFFVFCFFFLLLFRWVGLNFLLILPLIFY